MSYNVDQALKRPVNYDQLTPAEQWEIDRRLGVLDWDATDEECDELTRRWREKYSPGPLIVGVSKPTALCKETVLTGYYATGDYEAFCFDKHATPQDHDAVMDLEHPIPHHSLNDTPEGDRLLDECIAANNACRVYPQALLPDGTYRRKGQWKITVEFIPD